MLEAYSNLIFRTKNIVHNIKVKHETQHDKR